MRHQFEKVADCAVRVANRPGQLTVAATAIVLLGACGYAVTEGEGPIRSAWWAIVTASTVGYGDAYPTTTAGRAVAAALIVLMVTVVIPMITASFTSKLIVDRNAFTHEEQEEIKAALRSICSAMDLPHAGIDLRSVEDPDRPSTTANSPTDHQV